MARAKGRVLVVAAVAALLAGQAAAVVVRRRKRRAATARAPVTQSMVRVNPADAPMGEPGRNTEQRLDEGVQETFPASDPVSVRIE